MTLRRITATVALFFLAAGTVIAQAVVNYCPRHLPTLDAYIAKWG